MSEVSVIVPVYNVENILNNCIDSILNQTYKDLELVLVDDGSPDNSGKICDMYAEKDNRITVIHKENGGVSSARNAGIELASGKYICFVDSDDFLECDYLKELINIKNNYPEYENIWCGFQTVSDYFKSNVKKVIADSSQSLSLFSNTNIMSLHEKWLDSSPCNKLYNRRIIFENSITFPLDLSLGEDLLFNLDYIDCTNGKIIVINKPLYNYIRGSSKSLDHRFRDDLLSICRKTDSNIQRYLNKWNSPEEEWVLFNNAVFYKYERVLRNTFHPDNKISVFKKIKYNNQVLRSKEFREALSKRSCPVNSLLLTAYKSKRYELVLAFNFIVRIKYKFFRR